jgi:hypothetical protein
MIGIVILGIAGAAVVAIVVLAFRKPRVGGDFGVDLGVEQWRVGADGFYILGNYAPGTEVRYEYLGADGWKSGAVPASGQETYVYTGAPPTDVRILDGGDGGSAFVPSGLPIASGPRSSNDDDDVFTGFPSAY